MKIIIRTNAVSAEVEIGQDSDIHAHVEAITGALIAEGFHPASIIDGYESMARELKNDSHEEE